MLVNSPMTSMSRSLMLLAHMAAHANSTASASAFAAVQLDRRHRYAVPLLPWGSLSPLELCVPTHSTKPAAGHAAQAASYRHALAVASILLYQPQLDGACFPPRDWQSSPRGTSAHVGPSPEDLVHQQELVGNDGGGLQDLALHNVVVVEACQAGVHRLPCLDVQAHNAALGLLLLQGDDGILHNTSTVDHGHSGSHKA